MNKNSFVVFLLVVFILFFPQVAKAIERIGDVSIAEIAIFVEDQLIGLDTMPYMSSGTTMVPISFFNTELGASIALKKSLVVIAHEGAAIAMQINSQIAIVNGKIVTLPVPVQLRDGCLFVPLRFISEHFGAQVDSSNHEIHINTGRFSPNGKSYNSPFDFADKKEGLYIWDYDKELKACRILFVEKESFTQKTIITGIRYPITSINVIGSYIFYDDTGTLIRYNMETGESEMLSEKTYRAYVTGNTVYYLDTPYQHGGLWRMDIDGSNKKRLSNARDVTKYIVAGDTVYFSTFTDKLFKATKATNDVDRNQKIADNFRFVDQSNGYFYSTFDIRDHDDTSDFDLFGILYRMKEGESALTTALILEDVWFVNVRVVGNWVYYVTRGNAYYAPTEDIKGVFSYTGSLYRVSLDGEKKEQLTNVKTGDFYLFRGGFCYRNLDQNELVFCANLDI